MGRSHRRQMSGTRPAAVAGLFYPGEHRSLVQMVDRMLLGADPNLAGEDVPKAIIAPHAGYPYSGPIAANAFEPFRPLAGRVERVVVIGPSHHVPFRGLALPAADSFETPLGKVEIDLEASESLLEMSQVRVDAEPHIQEHSLEVELPFLQQVLGEFRLVPLVVGKEAPSGVGEALSRVWGGDETRIVISSDLSHFLGYGEAQHIDRTTADKVVNLEATITPQEACGSAAINGLLHLAAGELPLSAELLDLRNSGDTAGDRDRVVGYGAFSFN